MPEFGDVMALARLAAHAELTPMVLHLKVLEAAVGPCGGRRAADSMRNSLGRHALALPHDCAEVRVREDAMRDAMRPGALIKPKGEASSPMAWMAVLSGLAVRCGAGILCACHADSETCS
ncbi:hypothetical protein [Xanthomonas sp. MUS 060]|uniref:hypothetical protein n=1 Tax=Xanthomonas sp. MUS 060 TaxID=1588031 RepID=UPI0005F2B1C7|nr:hypothetical protein [Xanthomonas sp. MUS 060]